jgi:adenylate kinase
MLARGRDDDNEEVIRHRLEVYREQTAPLIHHYRQQNLLISVEAQGSIESITERIEEALRKG